MATLSNLMKTSPKVNEQVAGDRQNNNAKIDNKQDKESRAAWKGRGRGKREKKASKDANPLKYPAMIALSPPSKRGRRVGKEKQSKGEGGQKKNTREPLKVIMKDSQFVKWNFMA